MHSNSDHGGTCGGSVVVATRRCYSAEPGNLNLALTKAESRPDRKKNA